jgi:hypothetical protein
MLECGNSKNVAKIYSALWSVNKDVECAMPEDGHPFAVIKRIYGFLQKPPVAEPARTRITYTY